MSVIVFVDIANVTFRHLLTGDESSYFGDSTSAVQKSCSLLNAVLGFIYRCLLHNRGDKDNSHDAGGLFTLDGMKQIMQPLVDQVCAFLFRLVLCILPYTASFAIFHCNNRWLASINRVRQ